jgi:hypothetical protein
MSVEIAGFKSSPFFAQLKTGIEAMPAAEKASLLKKVCIFLVCMSGVHLLTRSRPFVGVLARLTRVQGQWSL